MNRLTRTALTAAAALSLATASAPSLVTTTAKGDTGMTDRAAPGQTSRPHPYVGLWVTADGHVRQRLLPNGRYDEARGSRESAYRGRYEVHGNEILYWDDTGFTADGTFVDGVLHHGGMVLYRRD